MVAPPEVRRAVLAYQPVIQRVRGQVEGFARRLWGGLENYRDADIDRMVRAIVPVSLGAQQRVVALTDNYLAAVATASGFPQSPGGVPVGEVTGAALRGVEPPEVYHRAGVTVWSALAVGKPLQKATEMGMNRLLDLLVTDLQLAKTHTARWRGSRDDTVFRYKRILSGGENCALCALASTQRYRRGDLLPIHPGCDCDIGEIRGQVDPGQVVGQELLDRERAGAPKGAEVVVRQHGEYGPTLTFAGQNFTGPADL